MQRLNIVLVSLFVTRLLGSNKTRDKNECYSIVANNLRF